MLKRTVFASLAALAISSPALAIEIPADAGVGFSQASTAYPSTSFNKILEACGLSIGADAAGEVPATYAKVMDGDVSFNDLDIAYTPAQYHSIFTAYGLVLSPEKAAEMNMPTYATVMDGDVVLKDGDKIAFNGDEWTTILAAYELPPQDDDGDGVLNDMDLCPDTPKGVVVNKDGCWIYAGDFLFDFDKATLKPEYKAILDDNKKVFDMTPDLRITIQGYTDSIGSEAYNQKLSERRAQAVVDYLVSIGVSRDRLNAVGYGESNPVASNDTAAGRAQNRRVEFVSAQK